jgi:hypothetical protein
MKAHSRMKTRTTPFTAVLVAAALAGGCTTPPTQQQTGMVIGGVLGGCARQGPCREYTVEGQVGGKRETLVGTACRQADGSWRVQP